jgi:anaerobic magnesium-protoporphyrin IX monomethyl ester cyclase
MKILYQPHAYSQQRQKEKKRRIYPVRLAMECEWYRKQVLSKKPYRVIHEVDWDVKPLKLYDKVIREPEQLPLQDLFAPDRIFTKAFSYTSGNYKHLPGTHILSAVGCWWGKCSFCVEKEEYQVRRLTSVISEIAQCKRLGFREIFDDAATFPLHWLDDFCYCLRLIKIPFSCNMRLMDLDYGKLKRSGFRMLLYGIESANQETLDRINKGTKESDIKYLKEAAKAGLEPHGAFMFGYPWETDKDAKRTLKLALYLLRKGYIKTAQASFYTPPDNNNNPKHKKYVKKIYNIGFNPEFWYRTIKSIKTMDDVRYILRGIKEWLS